MSTLTVATLLLLVMIWPLLLAAAVAIGATRPVALRLVPWAALPALVAAITLADSGLRLPDTLLASALVLDSLGRVFLLLNAILWLAAGLLLRGRLRNDGAGRFAVLQLLAMTGSLGLALAGDALLFFTAATLAGYALYGLLVSDAPAGTQKAGRVLVVLLVVSDLLVFELLLLLGQAAGSVDFPSLRQALLIADNKGVLLVLLIAGFGIKAGLAGAHFWLAPVFLNAVTGVRPALIAFMFAAGLLGWLRLVPLGELHWSAAGSVLQGLAWVTLGYAVIAGLLQAHSRTVLACAAVALSGFWVATLAAALRHPLAWQGMFETLPAAVLQSGLSLCVLMLFHRRAHGGIRMQWQNVYQALQWLAALSLACTPVAVAGSLMQVDTAAALQMLWAIPAITLLAVRGRLLGGSGSQGAHAASTLAQVMPQTSQASAAMTLLMTVVLTAGALLAAGYNLAGLSLAEFRRPALMLSAASIVAWLSTSRFMPYLPVLPPGDLLVPISSVLHAGLGYGQRLSGVYLPHWRAGWLAALRHAWSGVNWCGMCEWMEIRLNSWRIVLVLLLLLGLLLAVWGGLG
ncbi:MAG: proton-conducting transporter membrane subunit [Gammaproteobacteria bacterium]